MTPELQANIVGALIIIACVTFSVWILRISSKDRFPW